MTSTNEPALTALLERTKSLVANYKGRVKGWLVEIDRLLEERQLLGEQRRIFEQHLSSMRSAPISSLMEWRGTLDQIQETDKLLGLNESKLSATERLLAEDSDSLTNYEAEVARITKTLSQFGRVYEFTRRDD